MNLKDNSRNLPPIGQPKIRPINPRLEDLERKISRNFFEAAEALREIRDDKLYLVYAETFKEYCEKRLGKSIGAVYEQLKMLEIHKAPKDENVHSVNKPPLSEKDLSPVQVEKQYIKDLRKMARTPVVAKSPKTKEIDMPVEIPEEDERVKRWSQVMAKLRAAQNRDEEGLLESVEQMLENWGL